MQNGFVFVQSVVSMIILINFYPILGDNRIKEEPTMKVYGFQRSAANANGMSSSTVSTGDTL
jgi:hypothetical protein